MSSCDACGAQKDSPIDRGATSHRSPKQPHGQAFNRFMPFVTGRILYLNGELKELDYVIRKGQAQRDNPLALPLSDATQALNDSRKNGEWANQDHTVRDCTRS